MSDYPKIIFRYSRIYDQICKEKWDNGNYPSPQKVLNYIEKIEKIWKKEEKRVLLELSKVSNLKWREESIICYVVGRHMPFSMPLTMPVYEGRYDDSYFIDVLIHELIHNLLWMNHDRLRKSWAYIHRKYKQETRKTRIHIPLHALHSHVYLEFYNEERLKRDIDALPKEDFKRSWEIVEDEGYQNIIDEFVKRIRKKSETD